MMKGKRQTLVICAAFVYCSIITIISMMALRLDDFDAGLNILESKIPQQEDTTDSILADKRLEIQRPYMKTVSHAFLDSILEVERTYKPTPECDAFGGTKFIKALNESAKSIFYNGTSSIVSFSSDAMDIYYAENVSIVLTMPQNISESKGPFPSSLRLEVDGEFIDDDTSSLLIKNLEKKAPGTFLSKMTADIKTDALLDDICDVYIEYPVMLVDNDVNTNNWWFFLKVMLNHYIAFAVTQPMFAGNYKQEDLRILYSFEDGNYLRSFVDAFEFMFSDRRGRDSRQIWNLETTKTSIINNNEREQRYCFRKLLWTPGASRGGDQILINHSHKNEACFSSIVYAYAAHLKSSLHIPTLPRPKKPRVVWVGRDTSKQANPTSWQSQRIISNQDEVIAYLRDECKKLEIDLVVADFYGDKLHTAYQEQALLVSRADVMIGMHGAGLNMFHFMPFNSVIVEIHRGTTAQKNSHNYVNHIKEGKYISTKGRIIQGKLRKEPIWDTLKQAIDEWYNLGSSN